jgi:MYXO-CTERM domain-containing protein
MQPEKAKVQFAGLVMDSEEDLFGTARSGGPERQGVLFEAKVAPAPGSRPIFAGMATVGMGWLRRRRVRKATSLLE